MKAILRASLVLLLAPFACTGCAKKAEATGAAPPKHQHHPPHGGTPVVLGDEAYHVELVLDGPDGTLSAYLLDGEMENFIRSAATSLDLVATVKARSKTLTLAAVANPATGETVGDTSLFEGQADWLKTAQEFDATLKSITIRGTTFTDVKFSFPKGNDDD